MPKWMIIHGFTRYAVSENGCVRRLTTTKYGQKRGSLVKFNKMKFGYSRCTLQSDTGKWCTVTRHHAIALGFKGPRPTKKHFALHWDDNPSNDHQKNIRWGTQKENIHDMFRNGHNGCLKRAKLKPSEVTKIRNLYNTGHFSMRRLGQKFDVSASRVCHIINGTSWKNL